MLMSKDRATLQMFFTAVTISIYILLLYFHRITESWGLEGTSISPSPNSPPKENSVE